MLQIEDLESNVRSYCRTFTDTFVTAKNSIVVNETGQCYIDFFAGAGALNYGHNHDYIKDKLIDYIKNDGIMHALDMYTVPKKEFMDKFNRIVLQPKKLNYKMQFCGPTGTNAIEAAIKLARKVKKRTGIFSFMGGFHGMSLGSLACTSNKFHRAGGGTTLNDVTFIPYPYKFMNSFDSIDYINFVLNDDHSGIEKPAAIILETVQAEGGVIPAPIDWLVRLRELCNKHDILFICDEIQVGYNRTGSFFSFERANIIPDIIALSKSISGYGLPMSMLLLKPELDLWAPAEHNGTFRGNQLAFVSASATLELYEQINIEQVVSKKENMIEEFLIREIKGLSEEILIRGIGLIWGIDLSSVVNCETIEKISRNCFKEGLLIERVGREDTVLKIMPPLTIEKELLEEGCTILKRSIEQFI